MNQESETCYIVTIPGWAENPISSIRASRLESFTNWKLHCQWSRHCEIVTTTLDMMSHGLIKSSSVYVRTIIMLKGGHSNTSEHLTPNICATV